MNITREGILAKNAEEVLAKCDYAKMSKKAFEALCDMIEHCNAMLDANKLPKCELYTNNAHGWIYENYVEFWYKHTFCGFKDRRTGTFYNVVRMSCIDTALYREYDEAFAKFYNKEKQPNTKEVCTYGLDMP